MKSAYILQLEAKDVLDNTLEIKNKKRYSATLDYSLDAIQLQKINNTIFYYENDKLYCDAIISVKFTYSSDDYTTKQLRQKLYTDGFNLLINGKTIHYIRYKRSAGSARLGKVLFIQEQFYDKMMQWSLCGIDVANKKLDLASLESYVALSLSAIESTIKIKPNEILLIDDHDSKFTDNVIVCKEENGQLMTSEEKTEITNSIWDGQSLLDSSKFTGQYKNKSMMLLRNRFFKSNCINTNIKLYMKERFKEDYDTAVIKDMYGNDIRVKDIKLITTPNSIKYLKFGDYNYWLENLIDFGVVKTDQPSHEENGTMTRLNYQIINTLDLYEKDIEKLLEQEFSYFDLLKNDLFAIRHYLKIKQASMYEIDSTDDFIYGMLSINNNIANTEIFAKYKRKIIDSFARRLKECRILVNGTHATIFGNVYEMLTASVNNGNFEQILFDNEVYSPMFTEKQIIMCRNPHITMGNVVIANNTNNDLLKKYFHISNEIVIINSINNNILQSLNGADFDGDSVQITDSELLIEKSIKMKVPTTLVKSIKILEERTLENLANLDVRTAKNYIGEIVNLSQHLNSLFWNNKRNNLPVNAIYQDICALCSLSNIEIDRAKRETKVNTQKELKKIRDKYSITKIRPYYFKVFTSGYEYKKLDCPTDILLEVVEKESRKRSKRISKKMQFTSLFKNTNINMNNIDYDKIRLVMKIIYDFTNETKRIYNTQKDRQEKYLLYIQEKERCMSLIKNIPIEADEIKYIINLYDRAETTKNKTEEEKILISMRRKLFTILYNYNKKQFINIFKETKEEIEILEQDNNGSITIYNTNYSIKKI